MAGLITADPAVLTVTAPDGTPATAVIAGGGPNLTSVVSGNQVSFTGGIGKIISAIMVGEGGWFDGDSGDATHEARWLGEPGASASQIWPTLADNSVGSDKIISISADKISTGLMVAEITITGALLAGDPEGGRIILDSRGLRQYASATDLLVNFPTDPEYPAQFEGAVLAHSLTVSNNFTLQGLGNLVSRAAELRVASGTTGPTSPVSIAVGYSTYNPSRWGYLAVPVGLHANTDDSPNLSAIMGFFYADTFLGPSNTYYQFPTFTDRDGITRTKYSGISSAVAVSVGGSERLVTFGLSTFFDHGYTSQTMDTWDLSTMNSSGTAAPTLKAHSAEAFPGYQWMLGRVFGGPGTSIWRDRMCFGVQRTNTNDILLRRYVVTDTSIEQFSTDFTITTPFAAKEEFIGITYGSSAKMGFPGADQSIWLIHGSVKTYAYNATASARLTDFDFPTPPGAARMYAFGSTATNDFLGFRTTAWKDTTPITKMTNNHWASATTSGKWWVASTWYDPDATGGTHETAIGQLTSIVMPKRAGLTFTVPTFPERPSPTTTDDPTSARVYIARRDTTPTRTNLERAATVDSPNRSGYIGTFSFPGDTAANPPPSSSDFPSGTANSPGKIASGDGAGWVLSGDGKATLAGVEFDAAKSGFSSTVMRSVEYASDLSAFTTTSTTGATMGTKGAQGTFVAPPSGVVKVTVNSQLKTDTAGQSAGCSFEVRTGSTIGSGSVVTAADINKGSLNANTQQIRSVATYPVTGLTPGDTYNVRTIGFSTSSGATSTIMHTRLLIEPSA